MANTANAKAAKTKSRRGCGSARTASSNAGAEATRTTNRGSRCHGFKATVVSTKVRYERVITVDEIRRKFCIPDQAKVSIEVPGGGDWSGMELSIGDDIGHIKVSWEETK